ncbi:MAG: AIR synthase related protein, partial [Candidatus Omnitrophota bacterium]
MKELKFIDYITRKFHTKRPVIKGIGDDCAVLEYTKDKYMLLACDMIIEGTHFTKNTHPYQIGYKSMAVNISDIAAMGGIPKYALVSAGIPKKKNTKFLKEITRGIEALAKKFDISIIG